MNEDDAKRLQILHGQWVADKAKGDGSGYRKIKRKGGNKKRSVQKDRREMTHKEQADVRGIVGRYCAANKKVIWEEP